MTIKEFVEVMEQVERLAEEGRLEEMEALLRERMSYVEIRVVGEMGLELKVVPDVEITNIRIKAGLSYPKEDNRG